MLTELGVVERREVPGVPSNVEYGLTDPCGIELHLILSKFASSWSRTREGDIDPHTMTYYPLFADLWESGMLEELSKGPQSPTDLARQRKQLTYHQVNRRTQLLASAGLLSEQADARGPRRYLLTAHGRRVLALLVGIAQWRQRRLLPASDEAMTNREMGTALRGALPLVRLPHHAHIGKTMSFKVLADRRSVPVEIWAEVMADGTIAICPPTAHVDASAQGKVPAWMRWVLQGSSGRVAVAHDQHVMSECLTQLHSLLWTPMSVQSAGSPGPTLTNHEGSISKVGETVWVSK
jgi:DNA-binding HxlR family transcriptional regulator